MTIKALVTGMALAGATTLLPALAHAETLRLAHHHAVGGHLDQTAQKFAELVNDKTDGAITVRIFPSAQLGQEREAFEQLDQGIIDVTLTSLALMDRYWEPIQVTSLPFVWKSWDHADRAVAGPFGEAITEGMLENSNVRLLGIIGGGFRDMVFRGDPVTTVEGMNGLKMRAPEAHLWIRMFELLGARPTPVTWGEIYTAMQTGVAEGLEAPPLSITDMKLQEVLESLTLTQHMFLTYSLNINEARFEGLSEEHQDAILEAGREAASWSNDFAKEANEAAYGEMRAAGMQIVEPEDRGEWAAAMEPLWDEVTAGNEESKALLDMLLTTE